MNRDATRGFDVASVRQTTVSRSAPCPFHPVAADIHCFRLDTSVRVRATATPNRIRTAPDGATLRNPVRVLAREGTPIVLAPGLWTG